MTESADETCLACGAVLEEDEETICFDCEEDYQPPAHLPKRPGEEIPDDLV